MIKIDVLRKYLHIEKYADGTLYVYADNKKRHSKLVRLKDMDNECRMDSCDIAVPLADFLEVKQ